MEALGWRTISYEGRELAIRAEKSPTDITVLITDLIKLWCDRQSIEKVLNKSKKLNPLLEASSEKLLSHLYFLLSQSSTELDLSREDDVIKVRLKAKLDYLPFVWDFKLTIESPEKTVQYVIRPLLAMLKEDADIQQELCTVIRNKDKEIDDYKASGAAVSRKQLLTEEFNKERYFKERRWRSLDQSVKSDAVEMFCQTAEESNGLYNEIVKRITENDERTSTEVLDFTAEIPTEDTSNSSANASSKEATVQKVKEAEASRLEVVRKRLEEEERNAIRKLTQKKKPKLV